MIMYKGWARGKKAWDERERKEKKAKEMEK